MKQVISRQPVPSELIHAWERALHAWTDGALHDVALGLAAKHQQLAWLAARYREAGHRRPGDAIPSQRLLRLQRAALATLAIETRPAAAVERSPYRGFATLLLGSVLVTMLALWYVHIKVHGPRLPAVSAKP